MRSLRSFLSLTSVAVAALAFGAAPAHANADTYSIVTLSSDNDYFVYGMDDSGHVVIDNPSTPACGGGTCYYSYLNGVFTGISSTAPVLTWDYASGPCNTPPCSATKNGRTASVTLESDLITEDLDVTSGASLPQLLLHTHGLAGSLVINGMGDIVYDNGALDQWYEAIDLTTLPAPEPASLLLLATGALGILVMAMRRRQLTTIN